MQVSALTKVCSDLCRWGSGILEREVGRKVVRDREGDALDCINSTFCCNAPVDVHRSSTKAFIFVV